jgi:DNA polymerase type B, organellar and viral
MDGASGSKGSRTAASRGKPLTSAGKMPKQERQDIFVRAHTRVRTKNPNDRRWSPKWSRYCLIFDTETTLDPTQQLNFGTYRRCKLVGNKYVSVAEGLFYRDDLAQSQVTLLQRYTRNPKTLPSIELFPAEMTLGLMDRSSFIRRVFWKSVQKGELIVAYNMPFDISRLATLSAKGKKGEWSLALSSLWKNPKTRKVVPNPKRPRILVDAQNSKMAFIKLGSILHREEWPKESRFLDLRTLGWSLRNISYNLKGACKEFNVEGKVEHKPTGRISSEEIEYCRGDVAATNRLLNAMMSEFDRHPIDLHPDKAYSPASIAKAYLKEMRVKKPKDHFKAPNKSLGIAMQSYYGGRAECRIRKVPVPVIHTDFTSQYPTVNTLLGNWDVLTSSSVSFDDCTATVKRLLSTATLERTFDQGFWKGLSFFALVKPKDDILPVRTEYKGRTQNIGINYLTSEKSIWYAGPDVVASTILAGKPPKILKALRMVARGRQSGLKTTNLGGLVEIDPIKDDFYQKVIEQRISHKAKNKGLADLLKIIANSGSYGLFAEVNTETKNKETKVSYFSGEKKGTLNSAYVEKPGAWYFPPLASIIISGGRLLLAMLEKSVDNKGGSYLFCDTDSLCIVGTEKGGFVPCPGGRFHRDGKPAIKALSLSDVRSIADKFGRLNPYDPSLVRHILKIEDVNFVRADPKQPFRQLFGYAISAKRYALYTRSGNDIQIEKASGHGLGYLFAPKERKKDEETSDEETPQWIVEAWDFLLRRELGLASKEPPWLDLPAMMRMVVTTPNVLKDRRPEWLAPFNFFLFPLLSELGGYPSGFDKSNFLFITPMESDRKKWRSLEGINLFDGLSYQIAMSPTRRQGKVIPESFRIILRQYLGKEEAKSLAPDGSACTGATQGLLGRTKIFARQLIPVGKETDRRWEQGEDPSMIDPKILFYEKPGKMCVADLSERRRWSAIGVRRLMRESTLSQAPVSDALKGKPVRPQTLSIIRQTTDRLVTEL